MSSSGLVPTADSGTAIQLDRAPARVLYAAADRRVEATLAALLEVLIPAPLEAWAHDGGERRAGRVRSAPPRGPRFARVRRLIRERGVSAVFERARAAVVRKRRAAARADRQETAWRKLSSLHRRARTPRRLELPAGAPGGALVLTAGASPGWAQALPKGAIWLDASPGTATAPRSRRGVEWGLYRRDLSQVGVEVTRVSPRGRPTHVLDRRAVSLRPDDSLQTIQVRAALVAVDALLDVAADLLSEETLGYDPTMRLRSWTMDHFDDDVLSAVDAPYEEVATPLARRQSERLLEDVSGLRELAAAGWITSNHSARHLPIGEPSAVDRLAAEFDEAEREGIGAFIPGTASPRLKYAW